MRIETRAYLGRRVYNVLMQANEKSIAVIGGGASGLSAAIAAAERCHAEGADVRVVIYEKDDRVGRSILATGNGRCNFSNAHINIDEFYHGDFVQQALDSLPESPDGLDAVHSLFHRLGLVWREEQDGRQYPLANKASAVLDVLRARLDALKVEVETECELAAIEPPRDDFPRYTLRMRSGVIKRADAVVVACGGRTVSALQVGDIKRTPPRPILGPIAVSEKDKLLTRELDNIRVRASVSLCRKRGAAQSATEDVLASEKGELLFRKYGVSGICVFNLSRLAQEGDIVRINFLDFLEEDAQSYLTERRALLISEYGEGLTYMDMLRGLLLPRVAEAVLKASFINPYNRFKPSDIPQLAGLLSGCPLEVEGIADATLCQVRRGGFKVADFDPRTLQSRTLRGLYVAGEALDVDGPCGGYNLHWAWASGMIAGNAAARLLASPRR